MPLGNPEDYKRAGLQIAKPPQGPSGPTMQQGATFPGRERFKSPYPVATAPEVPATGLGGSQPVGQQAAGNINIKIGGDAPPPHPLDDGVPTYDPDPIKGGITGRPPTGGPTTTFQPTGPADMIIPQDLLDRFLPSAANPEGVPLGGDFLNILRAANAHLPHIMGLSDTILTHRLRAALGRPDAITSGFNVYGPDGRLLRTVPDLERGGPIPQDIDRSIHDRPPDAGGGGGGGGGGFTQVGQIDDDFGVGIPGFSPEFPVYTLNPFPTSGPLEVQGTDPRLDAAILSARPQVEADLARLNAATGPASAETAHLLRPGAAADVRTALATSPGAGGTSQDLLPGASADVKRLLEEAGPGAAGTLADMRPEFADELADQVKKLSDSADPVDKAVSSAIVDVLKTGPDALDFKRVSDRFINIREQLVDFRERARKRAMADLGRRGLGQSQQFVANVLAEVDVQVENEAIRAYRDIVNAELDRSNQRFLTGLDLGSTFALGRSAEATRRAQLSTDERLSIAGLQESERARINADATARAALFADERLDVGRLQEQERARINADATSRAALYAQERSDLERLREESRRRISDVGTARAGLMSAERLGLGDLRERAAARQSAFGIDKARTEVAARDTAIRGAATEADIIFRNNEFNLAFQQFAFDAGIRRAELQLAVEAARAGNVTTLLAMLQQFMGQLQQGFVTGTK